MLYNKVRRASLLGLFASTAIASAAWAHTVSIGYENAGPGSVNFWFGSYQHSGNNDFNEGSLRLEGPGGFDQTVLFDLLVSIKPLGLIDGVTNFYSDDGNPAMLTGDPSNVPEVINWQGSTFSGLEPGTYTFTYVPIANPTLKWEPWDDAILSNMVVLSGQIVGGGSDSGIMATEAGIALTEAQSEDLRHIVRANSGARMAAAEGGNVTVMSKNGPSSADFSLWARIAGGVVNADFGDDLDISHFLGQAGLEMGISPDLSAGVSIGGATTSSDAGGENLDGDSLFIQPYVAFVQDALTVVGSLSYTYTDYDDSTDVIDNGDRFAGTLSLAYDIPMDDVTTATPFSFLAYGVEKLNGPTDDINFFIGRAGVELSHDTDLLNTGTMHVYGALAAEYVSADAPEPAAVLVDYDDSRLGARVEAGVDFTIAGTDTQLIASAHGSGLFTDAPGIGGNIGLKIPF